MPRRDDSGEYELPRKKSKTPVWVILLVAIVPVGVVCSGCAGLAMWGRTLPTQPEKEYDARELLNAYANAPAKADDQLHGRRVTVKGTITGFLGDSVHLGGDGFPVVVCHMRHSDVVKLSKGQTVRVRGTVGIGNEAGIYLDNASLAD